MAAQKSFAGLLPQNTDRKLRPLFDALRKDIPELSVKVKRDASRGLLITKVTSDSDHYVSLIQKIDHPEVVEAFFKKKNAGMNSEDHFQQVVARQTKEPQVGKIVFYSEEAVPSSWVDNIIYEQLR